MKRPDIKTAHLSFEWLQRIRQPVKPVVTASPFEKGGSRGIYFKISPSPSFSKRGDLLWREVAE
ncbi:MAG: hypothetical protein CTY19_18725 [Methylomonas sp.]|nr:MAG: hypothetical protein CTY19_18725 [Methylomonas sp.]